MKNILFYPINHINFTYTIIFLIILFLIIIAFSKNYRLLVQKLIYKAEIGTLTKNRMYDAVVRLEKSDLDDRMILVISELMQQIPLLPLILPKKVLIVLLQRSVQRIFNQVKKLLDANRKQEEVNSELIKDIYSALSDKEKEVIITEVVKRVESPIKEDLKKMADDITKLIISRKG